MLGSSGIRLLELCNAVVSLFVANDRLITFLFLIDSTKSLFNKLYLISNYHVLSNIFSLIHYLSPQCNYNVLIEFLFHLFLLHEILILTCHIHYDLLLELFLLICPKNKLLQFKVW